MKTYEEYIEEMRKVIPECDWDQNEIDDAWEEMCKYEMYDDSVQEFDDESDYEPSEEALAALTELQAIMNQ